MSSEETNGTDAQVFATIFDYLNPTDKQKYHMQEVRNAHGHLLALIERHVPDCADRAHAVRHLRECAMWCNVAITRKKNGSPREK